MSALDPVTCEHHLPALRLTVKKESKNQGRVFYKCSQMPQCRTYIWEDELPGYTKAAAPEGPVAPTTPSSSQQTMSSQSMSQGSYRSQGMSTPGRKRAAPQDDNDDLQSPFDTPSRVAPFTPNKRVKVEGSSSWLSQPWAPPSPTTPAQPSGSQHTVTSTNGDDDESLEEIISRLHELPEYIKKLRRKKIAAEKSTEVRGRKIVELQKEVERLKAREQQLEEALAGQV